MRRVGPPPGAIARTAGAIRSRSRFYRLPSRSPDEARDTVTRFFDLLEARRIAGADMASPALAERAPRYGHDLLVEQQTLRELLVVHPRRGDVREAIERSARLEAMQPEVVEALQHHLPAPVVLADHTHDLVFTGAQRLERRVLSRGGYAHHRVLMDLHHLLDDLGRRAGIADAPSGHRVGLREPGEVDRALSHAWELDDRTVGHAVDETVVDLVRVEQEVVLIGEPGDALQIVLGQHGTRRVAREAEQDGARARRDRSLDIRRP